MAWCGVALLEHPANHAYPGHSFAVTAGAIQFLHRAALWKEPMRLAKGEELPLRYRVLAFDGKVDAERIAVEAEAFGRL